MKPYNNRNNQNKPSRDNKPFRGGNPRGARKPANDFHQSRDEMAPESGYENLVAGRNAVLETLKNGSRIDTVYIAKGATGGSIGKIVSMAKDGGYPVKEISPEKLDSMAGSTPHQGVAVTLSAVDYAEVEDILARAAEKGEAPFLIIADEIEDPHNLGALIRTAETAGAHGIIIPKRRNVGLTAAVFKTSAGAAAHLPIARVANLAATVDQLKEAGIWVYGADMEGQSWCQTDFSGGVALIVGSEGRGMNRLLKEKCDVMVTLPMCGQVTSLNASVAGGIIMYEVARQRLGLSAVQPKANG
jgi:23S rRNA (guanosine2251-2'-O)-methyltransferase